jgi:UMF1 family MFS transporter
VGEASTDRKAVWGWALYDFGNSAFFTVIVTFTYGVFFAEEMVPEGTIG